MTDAKDNPPVQMVRQRPKAWVLFGVVVVALLAADLGLKAWSFANITPTPLIVTVGDDGPLVYRPGNAGEPERVLLERTHPDFPASAVPNDSRTLVPGVLDLHLTLNTGAVFGIGQGQRWLFIVVSVLATGVILVLVWRSPADARVYHVALGMILSGALGNLYDRLGMWNPPASEPAWASGVRDWILLQYSTYKWPNFNIADSLLVCGAVMLAIHSFFLVPAPEEESSSSSNPSKKSPKQKAS